MATVCELFIMSSSLPTTVGFSLDEFARHGGSKGAHRDGWGIAYYQDGDVRLIKEAQAAADSACTRFVQEHALASRIVIAHLRKATRGARALRNTQPFRRELGGRVHVFAHNGNLPGIEQFDIRAGAFRPVGETDSEYAFCFLLLGLAEMWFSDTAPSLDARFDVVAEFARKIRPLGPANFIYSDGEVVFAHGHRRTQADGEVRAPGLWSLCRRCTQETPPVEAVGLSIGSANQSQHVVLVASVPLSHENWAPLAQGELIAISGGRVERRLPQEVPG